MVLHLLGRLMFVQLCEGLDLKCGGSLYAPESPGKSPFRDPAEITGSRLRKLLHGTEMQLTVRSLPAPADMPDILHRRLIMTIVLVLDC